MITDLFNASSEEWWNPGGRFSALHKINPLRFSYFSGKIRVVRDKKVLDMGCGGGILAEEFARSGAMVTGIDLSEAAIEAARKHAEESGLNIEYINATASDMLKKGIEPYDIVVCSEILEHVDDLEGFLHDATSLLKEGGYFLFSTLNKTLRSKIFAIYLAEYLLGMVPRGTHKFERLIRPSILVRLLIRNSVDVKEIKGMTFDPLRFEFKISDDPSINYIGYGIKKRGV